MKLNDQELIEHLRQDLARVKVQRNNYEQKLATALIKIINLEHIISERDRKEKGL